MSLNLLVSMYDAFAGRSKELKDPPSLSIPPWSSQIAVKACFRACASEIYWFQSSTEASDFLLSKEKEIEKVTGVYIQNHWGVIRPSDRAIADWDNFGSDEKNDGTHVWEKYPSERWKQTYSYNIDAEQKGKCSLSPLLAASIIEEAERGPADTVFQRAVAKTQEKYQKILAC